MMKRRKLESIALILVSCYLLLWFYGTFYIPHKSLVLNSKNDNINSAVVDGGNDDIEKNNASSSTTTTASITKSKAMDVLGVPKNHFRDSKETKSQNHHPVLTAYVQSGSSMKEYTFPNAFDTTTTTTTAVDKNKDDIIHPFPIIDEYPNGDSFLPWIHDLHPSSDGTKIQIYAQNRRRCHTGEGKESLMKEMEGQIALFQPIAIATTTRNDDDRMMIINGTSFRVASYEDANVHNETRFICRFKRKENNDNERNDPSTTTSSIIMKDSWVTFSTYPFNYEYISWRKRMDGMFVETGKDMAQFWLSSLQFNCPIPIEMQNNYISNGGLTKSKFHDDIYLDIITIKTPVRNGSKDFFFHDGHGGPMNFDVDQTWGKELFLPSIQKMTRWENIRLGSTWTPLSWEKETHLSSSIQDVSSTTKSTQKKKPFDLVACTWTSASHNRRGDAFTINDGKERLLEWIAFHLIVGYDHIVIYDNSAANTNRTSLKQVVDQFPSALVTYVDWPCKICNNKKPANKDPGERSSQYAAEASCRGRFAPYTEWMSFMDPDEYFVPMGEYNNWKDVLADVYKEGKHILKFRSTRARPLPNLMKPVFGPEVARCPTIEEVEGDELRKASCLVQNDNYTFLQTYNCEYIKSPKPERFQRAMKQIYRPEYVLSHFVHYSTITTDLARTKDQSIDKKYDKYVQTSDPRTERFVDEINEGVLVHTKSIVPEEAVTRESRCKPKLHPGCNVGIPCPDDLPFDDKTHQDGFLDNNGNFCNCWVNRKVENVWLPKLIADLKKLGKNNSL